MPQHDLLATMAFGLESVVADELTTLGYKNKTLSNGRVLFRADEGAIARTNLWLRAADRVLLRLALFAATDFGQLFDGVQSLPWEAWLPANAAFPVNGRSVKSQLSSVPACQKIVKKAIVERLRKAHRVQTLPETGPQFTVEVSLLNDEATLTLDTTGPGLNKRGYRTLVGEAQLKETLAAAMIRLCDWRPEQPLIDPFCGTGTLPIEAAMIARRLAPGLHREFASERWPALAGRIWREARQEARDMAQPQAPLRLIGSDIDEAALRQARFHARNAGVEADVQFQVREFTELTSTKRQGLVLCNPPYGERLGSLREVELLYRTMPAVFSRLPTWSFGILTSHERLDRLVNRRSDSRRKLYNGRIECWFYQFRHPDFHDADEAAIYRYRRSRPNAEEERPVAGARERHAQPSDAVPSKSAAVSSEHQLEMFANRLINRARHLRKWPSRGIPCYRLYEKDIPEIPLIIDRYEDCLHIVERPRPHDRTLNEHHGWLDEIVATATKTLNIDAERAFLHRYSDRHGPLASAGSAEATQVVRESGLQYRVNLSQFTDTGLPLDLRLLRDAIRKRADGQRVLCIFSNTGGLAVAAAAGGAAAIVAVDPLENHVRWTQENLTLNGFSQGHSAVAMPPGEFLSQTQHNAFDLVTIEDPTPGDIYIEGAVSAFQQDHMSWLVTIGELLSPAGAAYLITRNRRFKLDADALPGLHVREISHQTAPEDFRNRRIHRVWRMTRRGAISE